MFLIIFNFQKSMKSNRTNPQNPQAIKTSFLILLSTDNHYLLHQHQWGMHWLHTYKMCRKSTQSGKKTKSETTEMWAVYLAACCLTLWLYNIAFIIVQLPSTPQTNSHICLIKSSIENGFVEWKEIFCAENTCRQFIALCFPKEGCSHSNPDCVCVYWPTSV